MNSGSLRHGGFAPLALAVLVLAALGQVLPGCLLYVASEFMPEQDAENLARPEETSAAQITLAWDAPAESVDGYRVYFRIHGDSAWVQLGDAVAAPSPEYTVSHTTLGNGEFDFAVTAVYTSAQSSLHSSLDASASPSTGWYLKWQR